MIASAKLKTTGRLLKKWENPWKKDQQIAVCSYIKSDCIMPFKPKAKKLQSGSIIVSRKSLQKYKKFTNSKKFQNHSRGTGSSPLTRFKRELFAFPLQLNLCYQICNKVKACTSLHIWCSTGIYACLQRIMGKVNNPPSPVSKG